MRGRPGPHVAIEHHPIRHAAITIRLVQEDVQYS
jgi:hypothetical protein